MKYDFDSVIDRRNTGSIKYDFTAQHGKPEGILPLWVADMDFRTPPCVIRALVERSRHGIFGYSESGADYFEVVQKWFLHHFGWKTERDWLVKTPGVVHAICTAIRALTQQGDSVLIQQPVYYPFTQSILANQRKLVVNQLVYSRGGYSMDFEDFESKIRQNSVKLFILCSPHNPVGRVWTKEELIRMGDICVKYGVTVVSDEIHADFVYTGYSHTVFASLKPEFAACAITCTAPTKTFNLAGLNISNIFIQNMQIRKKIKVEMKRSGYSQSNVMGITACRAAYKDGHDWLDALRAYLACNLKYTRELFSRRLPMIRLVEPEGTYLLWLDFSALGLSDRMLDNLIVHKAGLWLDAGPIFGAGGGGVPANQHRLPDCGIKKGVLPA
jgi:cystathionine beta-lyase